MTHELGHVWGIKHQFNFLSVMNYSPGAFRAFAFPYAVLLMFSVQGFCSWDSKIPIRQFQACDRALPKILAHQRLVEVRGRAASAPPVPGSASEQSGKG